MCILLVSLHVSCPQMFTKFISTCLLPRTFTNVHKSSQILFLHVSFPEHSQISTNLISMYVSCPEHSQIFTNLISTCFLPRTFTNVHKSYFHVYCAERSQSVFLHVSCQNIHKCSQILFLHVSFPEHSQISTNLISTCLLPRTFTNLHKSYFYMFLAQNIHKSSQILFPRLLPRTFTNVHNLISTSIAQNVHKVYFYMFLAQNIHKCSQIIFPRLLPKTFTNVHKSSRVLFPLVSCPEHSQMFTILFPRLLRRTFTKFISTCFLPRTFTNVHKSYFHVSCPKHSQMFTNLHESYFHLSLSQNIHKCSQSLFLHVSCPQMFRSFISMHCCPTCNIRKIQSLLARNLHKMLSL